MRYYMRPSGHSLQQGLLEFVSTLPDGCVMAEIGCYAGEATRIFLQKAAHITIVDPWKDYVETNEEGGHIPMAQMADIEGFVDQVIREYPGRITKCKGRSVDVAATIPDASLDLVYIDANHAYDEVVPDLQAWLPKVKPGGLIAGHDYTMEYHGVVRAVRDLLGEPDAVFPDTTWVKRVPPGPKAVGPAPRLSQVRANAPRVLIGVPCHERGTYRPFDMCVSALTEGRTDTRLFYSVGSVIPGARNRIIREALRAGAEYVWFLDDDQPFFAGDPRHPERANDLDRLLAHQLDAVVPLSLRRSQPFLPLLYSTVHPTESIAVQRYLLPEDHGLIPVAGAGLAGLLIRTDVLLRVGLDGWFEFQHPTNDFDQYSEDLPFYRKLEAIGVQLYCDLDVSFGHAVTLAAYALKQDGHWMTVFADAQPIMMAPQPQHPLGLEYSRRQRDKVVPERHEIYGHNVSDFEIQRRQQTVG